MDIALNQRGRSSNEFLASLAHYGGSIGAEVEQYIADAGLSESVLEQDYSARADQITSVLRSSKVFQLEMLINEWLSINHGLVAIDAFEEISATVEPLLQQQSVGCCELTLNPDCVIPEYWQGVAIHRTTGGWDGHEHMGFIHREIIHKRYVSERYPWKIFLQRAQVLEELPPSASFDTILEMGCGTGHYTFALAERFPDAQIWGCDLSATLLRQAQRVANAHHWPWKLFQAPAEDTGLAADQFDLVTSYILLHELPATAIEKMFNEAFRVLKPGGTVMMSDARPLWDMDKLTQWRTLHRAHYGGEPFWQEATSLNLQDLLQSIGFEQATSYGLGDARYPWVTTGVKPQ